jgi:hypothetical protein
MVISNAIYESVTKSNQEKTVCGRPREKAKRTSGKNAKDGACVKRLLISKIALALPG